METKIPLIAENGQSLIDLTKNELSMSVYINLVKNFDERISFKVYFRILYHTKCDYLSYKE